MTVTYIALSFHPRRWRVDPRDFISLSWAKETRASEAIEPSRKDTTRLRRNDWRKGARLMRVESDLLVGAAALDRDRHTALPFNDSVIGASKHASAAKLVILTRL
jgi:hypothetical protein